MLTNGLGETLAREVQGSSRFVDLFTGSGAVAWHMALTYEVTVVATDLQQFSVNLADAVLSRTRAASGDWVARWLERARSSVEKGPHYSAARAIQDRVPKNSIRTAAQDARKLCMGDGGPIFNAYGGYYFSPLQALYLDALRVHLPQNAGHATVALAALIQTASRCSASPGHTAQPFKPNKTAGPFVVEAWMRDPLSLVEDAALALAPLHAKVKGEARKSDALDMAAQLKEGDLVFLDPPYSGVHYSRFYHVLETLASGQRVTVSGTGRYPPSEERPRSDYSIISKSEAALKQLLATLAETGCSVIITFPAGEASNGLSGDTVVEVAAQYFSIKTMKVSSRFSTLGGNLSNRDARLNAEELILTLRP
jgi:adenine-specific DNA methylase